jgi:hypothetical protein
LKKEFNELDESDESLLADPQSVGARTMVFEELVGWMFPKNTLIGW